MSEGASEHYGALKGQFESWLQDQGIKHAVIVSRDDLMAGVTARRLSSAEQQAKFKEFMGQFPDFPAGAAEKDINRIATMAFRNKASAFSYDTDGDGKRDTVVIVAPDRTSTKAEIAAGISGIPEDKLQNLPGTDLDWHAYIIAHEAGHAGQKNPDNKTSLSAEVGADKSGIDYYKQGHKAGLLTSADVPNAFINMRALGAFDPKSLGGVNTHFTGVAISTNGEGVAPALSDKKFDISHAHAKQDVAAFVGRQVMTEQDRIDTLKTILQKDGYIGTRMQAAGFELSTQSKDVLGQIVDGKIGLEEGLGKLDPEQRQKIAGFSRIAEIASGTKEMWANPHAQYEATRKLYLSGGFDDNPIGKQYAYEYLQAGRQHGQHHFGGS